MGRGKKNWNQQTSSLLPYIDCSPGSVPEGISATSSPTISIKPMTTWNLRKNSFLAELPRFENSRNVEMEISRSSNPLGCCILTDFDLNTGASSFFRRSQKPGSYFLIYVLFTAVGTDTSWNTFED